MAKNFVNIQDLTLYKELYDEQVASAIATAEARSLHTVSIEGHTLKFYREEEPVGSATPAYSITLPEFDASGLIEKISGATGGKVAQTKADGTIEEASLVVADIATKDYADTAASDAADEVAGNLQTLDNSLAAVAKSGLASDVQYKAAAGQTPAVSVASALNDIYSQIGEGGSVAQQISDAIDELDSSISIEDNDDSNPLNITITQENGELASVTASIDANTFDEYGSATAVQNAITGNASTDTVDSLTLNGLKKRVDAAQGDVDDLEALVGTGYGTKVVEGETVNKTVKEYIDDAQAAATYDDTALAARVTANEDAITLLNKTDGTTGSVKKTVDDAIAAVVAGAPEDFDTLKEMSDWISGHESDASAMNSAIQANTLAIGTAAEDAQGDPEDPDYVPAKAATGLYKKIEDSVAAETSRATGVEGGLDTRIQALEAKAGSDSVADQIDAAIGDLDSSVSIVDEQNTNPLNITVTQVDGVLTGVSGSIDANTFDTYGAASTAKSEVIGDSTDAANANTVYGAKAYADAATDRVGEAAIRALFTSSAE